MSRKDKWYQFTAFDVICIGIIAAIAVGLHELFWRNSDHFGLWATQRYLTKLVSLILVSPLLIVYWLLGSIIQGKSKGGKGDL